MNSRIQNELERKSRQATNPHLSRRRQGQEKAEKRKERKDNKQKDRKKTGETQKTRDTLKKKTRRQRQTGWVGEALEVRVCEDVCWDQ